MCQDYAVDTPKDAEDPKKIRKIFLKVYQSYKLKIGGGVAENPSDCRFC